MDQSRVERGLEQLLPSVKGAAGVEAGGGGEGQGGVAHSKGAAREPGNRVEGGAS